MSLRLIALGLVTSLWIVTGSQEGTKLSAQARGVDRSGVPRLTSTWGEDGVARASNTKQAMLSQEPREAVSFDTPLDAPRRARADRPTYVPGHIVVKFAENVSDRAIRAMSAFVGASAVTEPSYADFSYLMIPADTDPVEAAAMLRGQPGVVYAEADAAIYPDYEPNDPLYKYQWGLQKLDMPRAWDINRGTSGKVTVAVLDTGVAYLTKGAMAQAPDLAGTAFVPGWDFVWNDSEPVDLDGHGTHVTGSIAQTTNNNVGVAGMAFNVKIMPIKVIYTDWDDAWDAPYPYGSSTAARAIRYAVDNGARVMNMSFGAKASNQATLDAMQYAIGKGAFLVVSAGNEGVAQNVATWPAAYCKDLDGAIAVAALDYNYQRAPYSTHRDYVEIAAPGGNIAADANHDGYPDGILQQTFDEAAQASGIFNRFAYRFWQGTSMAAPHVTALAALLMDQGITSPVAIEAAMKKFATDLGPAGRDNDTGYGAIEPRATLRGLGVAR